MTVSVDMRCWIYRVAKSSTGDYNKHLSNSSYAKVSLLSIVFHAAPYTFVVCQNLDYARMKACVELFSPVFAPGVWMALGAGSYQFLKEIPMLTDYEIHISLAGFEEKWVSFSLRCLDFIEIDGGPLAVSRCRIRVISQTGRLEFQIRHQDPDQGDLGPESGFLRLEAPCCAIDDHRRPVEFRQLVGRHDADE